MKDQFVIVLFIIFILAFIYFRIWFLYKKKSRMLIRVQHENVCTLLNVNGFPKRIDYTQLPRYWSVFKIEEPDKYVFIKLASSVIIEQIKAYKTFEDAVVHLSSFDLVINNSKTKSEDVNLVKSIHEVVSKNIVAKLAGLARSRCHHIFTIKTSEEKKILENQFKQAFLLKGISEYFPSYFSADLFRAKEIENLSKKKEESSSASALVVDIKKTSEGIN